MLFFSLDNCFNVKLWETFDHGINFISRIGFSFNRLSLQIKSFGDLFLSFDLVWRVLKYLACVLVNSWLIRWIFDIFVVIRFELIYDLIFRLIKHRQVSKGFVILRKKIFFIITQYFLRGSIYSFLARLYSLDIIWKQIRLRVLSNRIILSRNQVGIDWHSTVRGLLILHNFLFL